MADMPWPAYVCGMKYHDFVHDQYQRPDGDDASLNRIEARLDRLARKMRDASGVGQRKIIRPESRQNTRGFAQSTLGLFPTMVLPAD